MQKKNFKKNNPALSFISAMQEEEQEAIKEQPTKRVEIKSKRVLVVLTPTLYEAIKETAYQMRISTNEAINRAIDKFIKEQS